ncbi:hypothetical protein [Aegicerativicinus sediminis]|uniref:hypothetical protein n=1 Tax=Aegicerativicinus sediminis TaxID=2893202 RepID=UPI001E50414A|nr:hypothetical protein [Aegicerativicinus sediminis]
MQPNNYLKNRSFWMVAIGSLFLLVSCGSYQYVGYDNDGIYGTRGVVYEEEPNNVTTDASSASYYSTYFGEKEQQYDYITQGGNEVFTDIDSYQGDYNEELDSLSYKSGYAGWGYNEPSSISINIYNRPLWNNWGWGFGYGYGGFYNPWFYNDWAWGYGYGYYPGYRFYGPNWFYNRPFWGGIGFGFGNWYPNYYNNFYYNRPYYNNRVVYQPGRRGYTSGNYSSRNYNNSTINRRSSAVSRNVNGTMRTRQTNRAISRLDPNSRENNYGIQSRRSYSMRNGNVRSYDSRRNYSNSTRSSNRSYTPNSRMNRSFERTSSPSIQRSAPSSRSSGSMGRSSSSSRGSSSGSRRGNN